MQRSGGYEDVPMPTSILCFVGSGVRVPSNVSAEAHIGGEARLKQEPGALVLVGMILKRELVIALLDL